MRCVVINLPRAVERREAIEREFKRAGLEYEIWEAVDSAHLTDEVRASVDQKIRERLGLRPLDDASLSCLMSHRAVHKSLLDSDDKAIAIFEDDASLDPAVAGVLAELEKHPDRFDIVKLARRYPEHKRPYLPVHQILPGHTIGRLKYADFGTEGYVITRDAARRLLERFPRPVFNTDWMVPRFWDNGLERIYYVNPPVVSHNTSLESLLEPIRSKARDTNRARRKRNPLRLFRGLFARHLSSAIRRRLAFRRLRRMDRETRAPGWELPEGSA